MVGSERTAEAARWCPAEIFRNTAIYYTPLRTRAAERGGVGASWSVQPASFRAGGSCCPSPTSRILYSFHLLQGLMITQQLQPRGEQLSFPGQTLGNLFTRACIFLSTRMTQSLKIEILNCPLFPKNLEENSTSKLTRHSDIYFEFKISDENCNFAIYLEKHELE